MQRQTRTVTCQDRRRMRREVERLAGEGRLVQRIATLPDGGCEVEFIREARHSRPTTLSRARVA